MPKSLQNIFAHSSAKQLFILLWNEQLQDDSPRREGALSHWVLAAIRMAPHPKQVVYLLDNSHSFCRPGSHTKAHPNWTCYILLAAASHPLNHRHTKVDSNSSDCLYCHQKDCCVRSCVKREKKNYVNTNIMTSEKERAKYSMGINKQNYIQKHEVRVYIQKHN